MHLRSLLVGGGGGCLRSGWSCWVAVKELSLNYHDMEVW